jgi:hypothetical protein
MVILPADFALRNFLSARLGGLRRWNLVRVAIGILIANQWLYAQDPAPAAKEVAAPPPAAKAKKSGLSRQRVAIKRQIAEAEDSGWFFWQWPKLEAPNPAAGEAKAPAAPEPVNQ